MTAPSGVDRLLLWTEARGRAAVYERSQGRCEVASSVCRGRGESWSHIRSRGQGGTWAPDNGLHACGDGTTGCHGWIEAHPEQARTYGWRRESWQAERNPVWIVNVHASMRPAWWHLVGDLIVWCERNEETHFTSTDCDGTACLSRSQIPEQVGRRAE